MLKGQKGKKNKDHYKPPDYSKMPSNADSP